MHKPDILSEAVTRMKRSRPRFELPMPLLVTCVNADNSHDELRVGARYYIKAFHANGTVDVQPEHSRVIVLTGWDVDRFKQERSQLMAMDYNSKHPGKYYGEYY